MVEMAKIILEFVIVYLLVFLGSYLFIFKRTKKYNKDKLPATVKYLVLRYNLDIVKLGYKRILKTLMYCDAFIVALVFTITRVIDNLYIRLLVAFILIFPLFAGVYYFVAKYYKKECD